MSTAKPSPGGPAWQHDPASMRWGWADAVAVGVWTAAILAFFWDVATLQKALFYFDITEINFPYRHFFAGELQAGRFSRWCPGIYCGFPLYSESQVGYLHPFKYLFYPWMAPWRAFNLDMVLSVWLTGFGTYGWLRRHVAPVGALVGAAVFALSGFFWAHFIHTSMTNALASVPLAVWALEITWAGGRLRGMALGALAVACQVFAGHLQDTLLTGMALGLYGLYRALIERAWSTRLFAAGSAAGLVGLGILLAAVQWIPSKELLDRSPRAGGLKWDSLTYGSWHPELLPTVLVREAYGTRARDTDWMDGFYPYHEMNVYLGVTGLFLALIGAAGYRDRWVAFWVLLAGVGGLLMMGRFTFLFDAMPHVPIVGSSRIPVRYHLWVSLAAAALAAVGTDRLARPGVFRLRGPVGTLMVLAILCVPILIYVYTPVWSQPHRWVKPYHVARYRWLANDLIMASVRTGVLAIATILVARWASRTADPVRRSRLAWLLPLLVIADLLGAHWRDIPTIDPAYWTNPPESAQRILADPGHLRVFGAGVKSAGEPGYASEPVDFLAARDTLAWSLPMVWGLRSAIGETPIKSSRLLRYTDTAAPGAGRFDIECVSHLLLGQSSPIRGWPPPEKAGTAYIHRNPNVLPRVRLMGQPLYASDEHGAARLLKELGTATRARIIVEDPDQPLAADAIANGTAKIAAEIPERIEVATSSGTDAYLFLADSFDPGWSATVDGKPVPIRPAYVAFKAVYVPKGSHRVVFTYCPAGFWTGLEISVAGVALGLFLLAWPRRVAPLAPEHGDAGWPRWWPMWGLLLAVLIVGVSAVKPAPDGGPVQSRWRGSWHTFTWGAGVEAMRQRPSPN